ncbi:MAG: thio(seleno)oxazole modification radical SAM maturase SbtM [Thermodesulfobacteriota bacterium]
MQTRFPVTRRLLPKVFQHRLDAVEDTESAFALLESGVTDAGLPAYLTELARLEQAVFDCQRCACPPEATADLTLNPTLQVIPVHWQGLAALCNGAADDALVEPESGPETILVWKDPATATVRIEAASTDSLIALKIAAEDLSPQKVALDNDLRPLDLRRLIRHEVRRGTLIAPVSRLERDPRIVPRDHPWAWPRYARANIFTLQWHVTQACDLHCRHCYDRSHRGHMPWPEAMTVLDSLDHFCRSHHVQGQITFTGGNPLLHPHFTELYREASDRGFILAILGNPCQRETLERLQAIQPLAAYQISLEGLEPHNDWARGRGHFQSSLRFLSLLQEMEISSQVMLTLTDQNMDQVLPLARELQGRADRFTFNRLSAVGEGASLRLPTPEAYGAFMTEYLQACEEMPFLGLKDNVLNSRRWDTNQTVSGGCTGFGCGAAFNFLSLLADGEVHACRKFPSRIGHIGEEDLTSIYYSSAARHYRTGPAECRDCRVRPVCGGCLAVSAAAGVDITRDRDPFCLVGPRR